MTSATRLPVATGNEVPGLGHQFPADFPSRLDGLLAHAGVTVS